MVDISEITIISIDKGDEPWAIEGEILFESDLTTPFSVNYYSIDDELENMELEINPGGIDEDQFKELLVEAAKEFDDEY